MSKFLVFTGKTYRKRILEKKTILVQYCGPLLSKGRFPLSEVMNYSTFFNSKKDFT